MTIHHGTPEFRRTALALFAVGFATFALLYCVQPLMPVFASDFHVSAAQSSLSLSLTTGIIAPAMIVAGALSEARGRKPLMVGSILASSLLTLACAFATHWKTFLVLRAIAGLAFAGLPAVSMAYLSEEIHPTSLGLAMGLMIGGNGLGGMLGRIYASLITDAFSWRWALGSIGVFGLASAIVFQRALPPSRNFVPRPPHVGTMLRTFARQLRDPALVPLFAIGFLVMGSFVTSYNYVTYHLIDPPYSLSHTAVGFIFAVYIVGIFASAYIGAKAGKVGRGRMLLLMTLVMLAGVALMTMRSLAVIIIGITTMTFGFFGGHSVASSWIGIRATTAKAQAAALYLFFYYMGSSVAGAVGGTFWDEWRWTGVMLFVAAMIVTMLIAVLYAAREEKPAWPT